MAKINRYDGNVQAFAAESLSNERTVFGSETQDDTLDQNINADFLRGWGVVGVNENPTKQDFNAAFYTLGQLIAYLHQAGIPEWNAAQEVFEGSVVTTTAGIYRLKAGGDGTVNPDTDDGTNWEKAPTAQEYTRTFETVSDLQAATHVVTGQFVRTLGYYTSGDGGGNDYEVVAAGTGTDDGGSFIDLAGSGLQAKGLFPFEVISIGQFGIQGGSEESAKFQKVVDYLPSEGGFVQVPSGDYSATDGSLVNVPFDKTVTFIVDEAATLPANIKAAVLDSGTKNHPHEGGSGASVRPGAAFYNFTARHQVRNDQANQQDSILYIEGEALPPGAGAGLTTEFAGVRVNMRMKDGTETGAGIRGHHITVTGDGGNAKLRGLRSTTIGLDGHDGLTVGGLFTATNEGIIPVSLEGDGTAQYQDGDAGPYKSRSTAMSLSVGPGIESVLELGGFLAPQRPKYGIRQLSGNGNIAPSDSVLELHGSGAGQVLNITENGVGSPVVYRVGRRGEQLARSYRSSLNGINIPENGVHLVPELSLSKTSGMFEIWVELTSGGFGKMYYRLPGTPLNQECYSGSVVNFMSDNTGALTGTTGPDGTINISCDSAGIYIENRSGATRTIGYVVNSN